MYPKYRMIIGTESQSKRDLTRKLKAATRDPSPSLKCPQAIGDSRGTVWFPALQPPLCLHSATHPLSQRLLELLQNHGLQLHRLREIIDLSISESGLTGVIQS